MPIPSTPTVPHHVAIAGGGVAALEAMIALRDLAGDRVRMTLIAPETDFVLRQLSVGEPFAVAHAQRYPLVQIAEEMGASFLRDAVTEVQPDAHLVRLRDGGELAYDALLLALGGRTERVYEHAITFGEDTAPQALHGLLADAEQGYLRHVAFVVPPDVSWSLPLYELALMTARQVKGMCIDDLEITFVTPEASPLEIFGTRGSREVRSLLRADGIRFVGGTFADVGHREVVLRASGKRLEVDRVVSLPRLVGPRLAGVPTIAGGFVMVNRHGRVVGVPDVYAAGDMTDFPIKQGGLATQQADAAAEAIAVAVGAQPEARPFRPVLRGMLLLGAGRRYLLHTVGSPSAGEAGVDPMWWPPSKIAGRYLSPYLLGRDTQEPNLDSAVVR